MSRTRRQTQLELDPAREQERPPHLCEWPGCERAGEFRAPRSRSELRSYRLFCLEHVRLYNQGWDFFQGMNQSEIEAYLREDVTWHRPTWPMGSDPARPRHGEGWRWQDPFGVFMNGNGAGGTHGASEWDQAQAVPTRTARMLKVMDLAPDVTRADIKARYKQLVKAHHPDLHGGDKAAEERLKLINEAYTYLLHEERFA